MPAKWQLLYSLNPMVGVIDGFRWCLLRGQTRVHPAGVIAPDPLDWSSLMLSVVTVGLLLAAGVCTSGEQKKPSPM